MIMNESDLHPAPSAPHDRGIHVEDEAWCNHDPVAVHGGQCECGKIVNLDTVVAFLTRRQRHAFRELQTGKILWARETLGAGAAYGNNYSRMTLGVLVEKGLADYVASRSNNLPYFILKRGE